MATRAPRARGRWSSSRLRVTQRLRSSWTRWCLRRNLRQQERAAKRLLLLELERDSQLLQVKELEQRRAQLLHRVTETVDSQEWRRQQAWTPTQGTLEVMLPPRRKLLPPLSTPAHSSPSGQRS